MGQTREQKIIKQLSNPQSVQKQTAIVTDMFLPNHSGISNHPEFKGAIAESVSSYVPYIGATSDVDLGNYNLYTGTLFSEVGSIGDFNGGCGRVNITTINQLDPTATFDFVASPAGFSLSTFKLNFEGTTKFTFTDTGNLTTSGIITCDTLRNSGDSQSYLDLNAAEDTWYLKSGWSSGDNYLILKCESDDSLNPQLYPSSNNEGQLGITGNVWNSVKVGSLTLSGNDITDSTGTIDFSNENLTTTGTIDGGAITGTSLTIGSNTGANGINFSGPWTGSSALNLYVSDTDTGDITLYSANFLHLDAGSNIYVDHEITYNNDATFNENINMSLTHGIYWPEETPETYGQPYLKVNTDSMSIYGGYSLVLSASEQISVNSPVYFGSSTSFTDEIITTSNIYAKSLNTQFFADQDSDLDEISLTTLGSGELGLVIVSCPTDAKCALYRLEGSTAVLISGNAIFTQTKDTASSYNFYWSAGDSQFVIQNKVGNNKMLRVGRISAY